MKEKSLLIPSLDRVIIVLILVVLSSVLFLGWWRSDKVEIAYRLKRELYVIERAVQDAAIYLEKKEGEEIHFNEYRKYINKYKRLQKTGEDPLGNPYGQQFVGVKPKVPRASYEALEKTVDALHWQPFEIEE